jgi:class I fructose-bisphosphate aldolase
MDSKVGPAGDGRLGPNRRTEECQPVGRISAVLIEGGEGDRVDLYRMGRLFDSRSGRCLNVAVDHGLFGEPAFLKGIENMPAVIKVLASAHPDAIQLTRGQAPLLQGISGKEKPALVLRADVANIYGNPMDSYLFSTHFPDAVIEAVRLDACCVVVNLLHLEGRPQMRERCIETILALWGAAHG